jgi:hypothetical protein
LTCLSRIDPSATASAPISPLMLSDHLLRLAEEADSVGLRGAAEHLLDLASEVLDQPAVVRTRTS